MKKNSKFEARIDELLASIDVVATRTDLEHFAYDFRTRMEDLVKTIAWLSLPDLPDTSPREVTQLFAYDAKHDGRIGKAIDSAVERIVKNAGRDAGSA